MEHGKDQLTRKEFSRILETNVVGTYMVTKAACCRDCAGKGSGRSSSI